MYTYYLEMYSERCEVTPTDVPAGTEWIHKVRMHTQAVRLALAASAIVAGSIAVAGPANAVATPAEACGSNYHEIDHHDIPGARIHLLYNGSVDCVVTTQNSPGTAVNMYAQIAKQNADGNFTDYNTDEGKFAYYAGPVRVTAPGVCIDWGGMMTSGGVAYVWFSGASHCR